MGVKVGDLNANCLLYADDAELIASSECELQALVTTLKDGCEYNDLSLNMNRTRVLIFERYEERTECKISVNGKILEQGMKWYTREVCSVEMEDTRWMWKGVMLPVTRLTEP